MKLLIFFFWLVKDSGTWLKRLQVTCCPPQTSHLAARRETTTSPLPLARCRVASSLMVQTPYQRRWCWRPPSEFLITTMTYLRYVTTRCRLSLLFVASSDDSERLLSRWVWRERDSNQPSTPSLETMGSFQTPSPKFCTGWRTKLGCWEEFLKKSVLIQRDLRNRWSFVFSKLTHLQTNPVHFAPCEPLSTPYDLFSRFHRIFWTTSKPVPVDYWMRYASLRLPRPLLTYASWELRLATWRPVKWARWQKLCSCTTTCSSGSCPPRSAQQTRHRKERTTAFYLTFYYYFILFYFEAFSIRAALVRKKEPFTTLYSS